MNRRAIPRALLLVAVAVLVGHAATVASPVAAQDDGLAEVGIEVLGTVSWETGDRVDGRVSVAAERAISGTVTVVDDPEGGTPTTYEFDVDLAAGTTAAFPVGLTTGWDGVEASATVRSGGVVVAQDQFQRFGEGNDHAGLLGVLGIDDPPPPGAGAGRRRPADRGPARPPAAGPGEHLVAGHHGGRGPVAGSRGRRAAAVGGLDPGRRSADRRRPGGQPGSGVPPVPHRQPGPVRLRGRVDRLQRAVAGRGAPRPATSAARACASWCRTRTSAPGHPASWPQLANIALPGAGLVAGALLAYTLLAGPVTFGFLTVRRAQRRIWTILPLLSVGAAALILGVGLVGRSGRSDAHVTIVEVNERGSRATANLLLTSSFGGNRDLAAPAGWTYLGQGRIDAQRPVRVRVGGSTTELALDMPPGSSAMTRFTGVAPQYDGVLTIQDVRPRRRSGDGRGHQPHRAPAHRRGRPAGRRPVRGRLDRRRRDRDRDRRRPRRQRADHEGAADLAPGGDPVGRQRPGGRAPGPRRHRRGRGLDRVADRPGHHGLPGGRHRRGGLDRRARRPRCRCRPGPYRPAGPGQPAGGGLGGWLADHRTAAQPLQPEFEGNFSGFVEQHQVTFAPGFDLDRLAIPGRCRQCRRGRADRRRLALPGPAPAGPGRGGRPAPGGARRRAAAAVLRAGVGLGRRRHRPDRGRPRRAAAGRAVRPVAAPAGRRAVRGPVRRRCGGRGGGRGRAGRRVPRRRRGDQDGGHRPAGTAASSASRRRSSRVPTTPTWWSCSPTRS